MDKTGLAKLELLLLVLGASIIVYNLTIQTDIINCLVGLLVFSVGMFIDNKYTHEVFHK